MATSVRIVKSSGGTPVAEIVVDPKTHATDLGTLVQKVTTDPKILTAAGLKACGMCKSGLNIAIIDRLPEIINVGH